MNDLKSSVIELVGALLLPRTVWLPYSSDCFMIIAVTQSVLHDVVEIKMLKGDGEIESWVVSNLGWLKYYEVISNAHKSC